jgi:hypothetical protein
MLGHHGDIRVESEPGRGSRFIVVLPPAVEHGGRQTDATPLYRESVHNNDRA